MHKSGDMLFSTEYERIRDDHSIPATHSIDPANQWKNRFTNIVAYDHNRVKLIPFDDEPASDYINASFIDGYEGVTYIATQGPLEETSGDFWRMVWEQDTRVIVMVSSPTPRGCLSRKKGTLFIRIIISKNFVNSVSCCFSLLPATLITFCLCFGFCFVLDFSCCFVSGLFCFRSFCFVFVCFVLFLVCLFCLFVFPHLSASFEINSYDNSL